MKRIFELLIALLFLSVILTGCYLTGEKNNSGSEHNDPPVHGGEHTYIATFDYQISHDFPAQVPKIKVKVKKIDKELVKNALLRDKTIIKEEEFGERTNIITSDDQLLNIYSNSFNYFDRGAASDPKDFTAVALHYNNNAYISEGELKNFSRKEAVERVNTLFDEVGINNYGEPYIIPITPEMANYSLETYGSFNFNGEYTLWTEDDGEYILIYPLNVNGINTSSLQEMRISGRTVFNEKIVVYITKDCILDIEMLVLHDIVSEDEGMAELRFDAEYASNELKSRYSKIILDYPTFFTECRLEYIPFEQTDDSGIIYAPAWCFSGYQLQGPEKDVPFNYFEYYYAETGIRWGGY